MNRDKLRRIIKAKAFVDKAYELTKDLENYTEGKELTSAQLKQFSIWYKVEHAKNALDEFLDNVK